ncbi:MAG: efflux RND transporter periplasmic adaptor subunit [Desulfobulbaceae bacterium]|jgi:RND family efflux transporter MFP subunit|nr:efflux RND transporter periplasmic adaptor subunit [Desulfobulbaceae bacterium]
MIRDTLLAVVNRHWRRQISNSTFHMKTSDAFILFLSLLAAVAVSLVACDRNDKASAPEPALPAAKVRLAVAAPVSDKSWLVELPGTVRAVDSAQLAPKIMGTVASIPVTLGQEVKRGDLLVKLSAAEIDAKLSQAETGLRQAERDWQRERALLVKGASTADTVRNLEDRRRIAQAQVDEARAMLGYTTITAPFNGVVTQKMASAGDLATPGHPLLTLENPARLRVVTDVPESLARIAVGSEVMVKIGEAGGITGGVGGGEFPGRLAEVTPASDLATRTFTAKIDLPRGADNAAHPGQFAKVAWPGGKIGWPGAINENLIVPRSAVTLFGQMERVFVADNNGRASLRIVKTGAHRDGMVEILAGLSAGEKVVTEGADALRDGQPLEVLP